MKPTQTIPLLIALLGSVFAPASYWCIYSNGYCYATFIHQVYQYFTNPLYNFSLFVLPIAIILIFVSRNTFVSLLKFAAWAIPLAVIFIWTTPINFSGIGMDFFPFYRDDAARLWGGICAVTSFVVLAFSIICSHLYTAGREYNDEDIKYEVNELKTLFVAGVGLVSAGIALWFSFAKMRGALDAFVVIGGLSILTTLYALGKGAVLSYKKRRKRMLLGWKLVLVFVLVTATTVALLSGFWIGNA